MTDDEIKPEAYPDYDAYWREQKADAKADVKQALDEYDPEIQIAVLSELADEYVQRWAENSFSESYVEGKADE